MSLWRWEFVRARDGRQIDRATKLWILCKASVPMISATGYSKKHVYRARHIATGTVVGTMEGAKAWQIDTERVAELEPDEV